ncbi:sensor histidine kinase [Paenibacillus sp.]|uniref:sensor histidine kinase n=2 Tax=Paenibacillus TaxID=44249 RepID=UPI0015AE1AF1|nr:sensor histidine kinase [Paenibacillus sp.]MDU2242609.1 ATP-binding protein [Paenibacillus sp.]
MEKKLINFKVNARHIGQLGRELVTDYSTALVEIVKNSYDADAEGVKVIFENVSSSKSKLIIVDNGSGMTRTDVENKWTVIGTNNKLRAVRSPGGRKYAGKKGIGRFAVERLAERIAIYSFPENEPPFKFTLNWNKYEQIDVTGFMQRVKLLKFNPGDVESAKYLASQVEYLLNSESVSQQHKNEIQYEIFQQIFFDYMFFLNNKKIDEAASKLIPILELYQDEEVRIQDVYHELSSLTDEEKLNFNYIEELIIQIESKKEKRSGIVMVLEGLRDIWRERDIKKIQKELRVLVAPNFLNENPFKPILSCNEYNIQEEYIVNDILSLHFAKVDATLLKNGSEINLAYKENQGNIDRAVTIHCDEPLKCGDVKLELFYFLRDSKYLSNNELNVSHAREILDQYCGIKIYRDGFHVKPYGDIGNDWLFLDQSKVKDTHSYLVSNNQVIGIVELSEDKNPLLIDSTDREGIIENEAFEDLRKFILRCTDFISEIRREELLAKENKKKLAQIEEVQRIEDEKKKIEEEQRAKAHEERMKIINEQMNNALFLNDTDMKGTFENITRELKEVTNQQVLFYKERLEEERRKNEANDKEKKELYEEELDIKDRELSLYRNLATLGMLTGAFGHETSDIINRLNANINFTKMKFPKDLLESNTKISQAFSTMDDDLQRISGYSKLIVNFVQKKNRENFDYLNFREVIMGVVETYSTTLSAQKIDVVRDLEEVISDFKMYKIDLESIVINMLTNSFEALKRTAEKKIFISCREEEDHIKVIFQDNGSGIPQELNPNIFSPFFTTKDNGVGLGLSIVRDIVVKYNGSIESYNSSEHGGATFEFIFKKEKNYGS